MSLPGLLACCALVLAASMLLLWLLSLRLENASIVDLFWGMGFVVAAALGGYYGAGPAPRRYMLVALVALWGIRLSGYLTWRNWGAGEDRRYQAMRRHHGQRFWWVSLLTVFLLQGALVWLIAMPILVAQTTAEPAPLGALAWLGGAAWFIGVCFETVGDLQLARFKADPQNRGKVMDRGLWRYTRHPNYFGDALVWWGLFLVAVEASGSWWTIYSPLLMTTLLLRVSGVALLEKDIAERRPGYLRYIQRTSAFIPWPPRAPQPADGG